MALIKMAKKATGFTLIEVLLALTVIAIALGALLKSSAQTVANTNRLKEKTISHWVAEQGIIMIQLGLLPIKLYEERTHVTRLFKQRWYWRAAITPTSIKAIQRITIRVAKSPAGPFKEPLIGFRYGTIHA